MRLPQYPSQRHVERGQRPGLAGAAFLDALAAHLPEHVEYVAHVGIEPVGGLGRCGRVRLGIDGIPAYIHR